ncbi:MAG TPA: TRAP transporter small permease [Stellaceae bacterium]|nr:TRAP transporter small permease [Stellaceae bacterium]
MMALTFIEVIARYFLAMPLTGVEEIKSFLLGFTIFTALPLVTRLERHIAVRSLANLLRGRAHLVQRAVVLAGTALGLGFLGVLLWGQANSLARDGALTNFLDVPMAPPIYVFSVLAACASLAALERLIILIATGGGEAEPAEGPGPE